MDDQSIIANVCYPHQEVSIKTKNYQLLLELADKYGNQKMVEALRSRANQLDSATFPQASNVVGNIENLDDYSACKIAEKGDLRDLFVKNFYFGCEADDPMNAWAFQQNHNPFGVKIPALFGSDIGHFDVPNMEHVLPEAYELVENSLISEEDFRDFLFANPVRFWGEANPNFFAGTVVEKDAAALLGGS